MQTHKRRWLTISAAILAGPAAARADTIGVPASLLPKDLSVGAMFLQGRFTAPWCYQSPNADTAAAAVWRSRDGLLPQQVGFVQPGWARPRGSRRPGCCTRQFAA